MTSRVKLLIKNNRRNSHMDKKKIAYKLHTLRRIALNKFTHNTNRQGWHGDVINLFSWNNMFQKFIKNWRNFNIPVQMRCGSRNEKEGCTPTNFFSPLLHPLLSRPFPSPSFTSLSYPPPTLFPVLFLSPLNPAMRPGDRCVLSAGSRAEPRPQKQLGHICYKKSVLSQR